MEKTNAATPAKKTQELVENFFDAFDHTSVLVLIEQMGVEYLASEAHCGGSRQARNAGASMVFSLYHLVEDLHEVQELEPG